MKPKKQKTRAHKQKSTTPIYLCQGEFTKRDIFRFTKEPWEAIKSLAKKTLPQGSLITNNADQNRRTPEINFKWQMSPKNTLTNNNQRLEKCVRCVLLPYKYNWDLRVFLADHLLQTWSYPLTFEIHDKAA